MAIPALELDERWYTVLARSETHVLTQHTISGEYTIWQLQWRDMPSLPKGFAGEAWQQYLKKTTT